MTSNHKDARPLRDSVEALCEATKLLAVTVKAVGYPVFKDRGEDTEQLSRQVERVSDLADQALQLLQGDEISSDVSREQSKWLRENRDQGKRP